MGIKAIPSVDKVNNGNTETQVQYLVLNVAAAQTALSIIAAAGAGIKIKVIGVQMQSGAVATAVTFNSAAVAISPTYGLSASQPVVYPPVGIAYFQTVANEALTITTGAGSTTAIMIQYIVGA